MSSLACAKNENLLGRFIACECPILDQYHIVRVLDKHGEFKVHFSGSNIKHVINFCRLMAETYVTQGGPPIYVPLEAITAYGAPVTAPKSSSSSCLYSPLFRHFHVSLIPLVFRMDRRVVHANSSQHRMCGICHHEAKLVHIYGGLSCRACVAFFIRAVKRGEQYECKRNALACGEEAVLNFSANHACRKCRFARCLREGMKAQYVKSLRRSFLETMILNIATVDESLPLLFATVQAITRVNLYSSSECYNPESMTIQGTSEIGANYLTGFQYRTAILQAASRFRQMFNFVPIVCEVDPATKEAMFKNCLSCYFIMLHSLSNAHCLMAGSDEEKYFLFPDKYVDLDEAKLEEFFRTYRSAYDPSKDADYRIVSRAFVRFFLLERNLLSFVAKEYFLTDEDLAAFILVLIIHTNKSHPTADCQQVISRLKNVWNELDAHYRASNRDPSKWGNLLLFLSNVQSISAEFLELMKVMEVYLGGNVYIKVIEEDIESIKLD